MSKLRAQYLYPDENDTLTNGKATFGFDDQKQLYSWFHRNLSKAVSKLNGSQGVLIDLHGYLSSSGNKMNYTFQGR